MASVKTEAECSKSAWQMLGMTDYREFNFVPLWKSSPSYQFFEVSSLKVTQHRVQFHLCEHKEEHSELAEGLSKYLSLSHYTRNISKRNMLFLSFANIKHELT